MIFFAPFFIAVVAFAAGGNRSLALAAIIAGATWFLTHLLLMRRNPKLIEDERHPLNFFGGLLLYAEWILAILACVLI